MLSEKLCAARFFAGKSDYSVLIFPNHALSLARLDFRRNSRLHFIFIGLSLYMRGNCGEKNNPR